MHTDAEEPLECQAKQTSGLPQKGGHLSSDMSEDELLKALELSMDLNESANSHCIQELLLRIEGLQRQIDAANDRIKDFESKVHSCAASSAHCNVQHRQEVNDIAE